CTHRYSCFHSAVSSLNGTRRSPRRSILDLDNRRGRAKPVTAIVRIYERRCALSELTVPQNRPCVKAGARGRCTVANSACRPQRKNGQAIGARGPQPQLVADLGRDTGMEELLRVSHSQDLGHGEGAWIDLDHAALSVCRAADQERPVGRPMNIVRTKVES